MAKVLLVEDDNNLREIYQARLAAEGYDIVAAQNGEEALVVAKQNKPDLIISDVMMPRISGFEMLDILRNTEGLKHTKVIMLTALGQAEDQKRADNLGADKYLVKSQVTLEDIVNAAKELLDEDGATTPTAALPAPEIAAPPVVPIEAAPNLVPQAVPVAVAPTPSPTPNIAPPSTPPAPIAPEPSLPPAPAPVAVSDDTTLPPAPSAPLPYASQTEPISAPTTEPTTSAPVVPTAPAPEPTVASEPAVESSASTPSLPPAPAPVAVEPSPEPTTPTAPVTIEAANIPDSTPVNTNPTPEPIPTPTTPPEDTPEPAVAVEPPATASAEAAVSDAATQTLESEEAALQAQIESYSKEPAETPSSVEAAPTPPPEDSDDKSNEEAITEAVEELNTPAPEEPLQPPSVTNAPAPTEPVQQLAAEPVTAPPVASTPEVKPVSEQATVAGKKVIQPLNTNLSKPDLGSLLAKEESKAPTMPASPIIGGTQAQPSQEPPAAPGQTFDPNSVAL